MGKFLARIVIQLKRLMTTLAMLFKISISQEKTLLNTDLCINSVFAAMEKYKHHQSIISQGKLIANAFIMSQLSYCPLINRINRINERALRFIYLNQNQLTFKQLLLKTKTVSKHQINLKALATEIYKTKSKISPEAINSLFEFTNKNYDFRNAPILKRKRNFTAHFGSESLSSLGTKIWELVPNSFTKKKTLSVFKNKTKVWTTKVCAHVDFGKIIKNESDVPIIFMTVISFFSILGHKKV